MSIIIPYKEIVAKILRSFAPLAIGLAVILMASVGGLPGAIGQDSAAATYGGGCCLSFDSPPCPSGCEEVNYMKTKVVTSYVWPGYECTENGAQSDCGGQDGCTQCTAWNPDDPGCPA